MLIRFIGLPIVIALAAIPGLAACNFWAPPKTTPSAPLVVSPEVMLTQKTLVVSNAEIDQQTLKQSWEAYRQRFIQMDGRVIDWEGNAITTSEGQAYAMLRAVLIDDPDTFERTLQWAENNLKRETTDDQTNSLWAWKWGKNSQGTWGILDHNFASDADIDAVTALILASRRWQRPDYLALARTKLHHIWQLSTFSTRNQTYLLPGPAAAFQQSTKIQLNPSYLAPYAFRLFAQVDANHDWLSLVKSSYQVLEASASLSQVGLPSDWVLLDTNTGNYTALPNRTQYGFDAFRVWWRISLDADWFKAPEAQRYLTKHLQHLQSLWRSQQRIPARIGLQGQAIVDYEATSQYGMLYNALRLVDPVIAKQIYQQKIAPRYRNGFWDNDSAYYTQNLVWFGVLPSNIASALIQTRQAPQATTQP